MGIQQDKLLNWLMVRIAAVASKEWWDEEFYAGKLAAYRELEAAIHHGTFSDLKDMEIPEND